MKKRVLVICTGNSCRSQMAEAIINSWRGESWQAFSAGSHPADRVNPHALKALAEIDIHTEGSPPQFIQEYVGEPFDTVITVCDSAKEACPVWIGQGKVVHISFPDPVDATGTEEQIMAVYRQVRDDIAIQIIAYLDAESSDGM